MTTGSGFSFFTGSMNGSGLGNEPLDGGRSSNSNGVEQQKTSFHDKILERLTQKNRKIIEI